MRCCCVSCWSVCSDDRAASQHADLDCCRGDRSAARVHGAERTGTDHVGAESVIWSCFCVPRATRGFDQGDMVRWRRAMSIFETAERGRLVWPQATSGSVALTRAQLSMLLEGIDWRRPERTWDPHA